MEAIVPLGLTGLVFLFSNARKNKKTDKVEYDILQYRNPNSYTKDTLNYIRLVTTKSDVNPVGSQRFKVHRYPGDIDIFEKIQECCTLEDSRKIIAEKIRTIAKNIKKTPFVYLGDFKAGIDDRFFIDIGSIKDNKVKGYDYDKILKSLKKQHKDELLSDSEYSERIQLLKEKPSIYEFEETESVLRKKWIIRWTLDELIKGRKVKDGQPFYLYECLSHPTIVKIDVWAPVEGRYTELTNFFVLSYLDKNGKQHPINIELEDRLVSLKKDIVKYSNPLHRKSLKYAKRLWIYAQLLQDDELLKKLFPLFSSSAGILSQITSEIETLTMMLENLPNPPISSIIKQIDGFKSRVNSIYDIDLGEKTLFFLIDTINEYYDKNKSNIDKQFIIKYLKQIDEQLAFFVEDYSFKYIEKTNLINPSDFIDKL